MVVLPIETLRRFLDGFFFMDLFHLLLTFLTLLPVRHSYCAFIFIFITNSEERVLKRVAN